VSNLKKRYKIQLGYALGNGVARNDRSESIGEEFTLEDYMVDKKGNLRDAPDVLALPAAKGEETRTVSHVLVAMSESWNVYACFDVAGLVTKYEARGPRSVERPTFLALLREIGGE
jgi:hypothetical protein